MEQTRDPLSPETTTEPQPTVWHARLTEVTTASKIIAAFMMIILPFAGGYVGWQIALINGQNVATTKVKSIIVNNETTDVIDVATINPADIKHYRFDGRRTGYFSYQNRVFFTDTFADPATENLVNGQSDWLFDTSKAVELKDADHKTFEVISREPAQVGTAFAKDDTNVFWRQMPLLNADPASAVVFGQGGSFLVSDKGLYLNSNFIVDGTADNLAVFIQNTDEGFSPYHVYIHRTDTNEWYRAGNMENKPFSEKISTPPASALADQIFPSQTVYLSQDYSEEMRVTEDPNDLFVRYFESAGNFRVTDVTASAIYGRRLNFEALDEALYVMGTIKMTNSYYYDRNWIISFEPDNESKSKLPKLKGAPDIAFVVVSPNSLCTSFDCNDHNATYKARVKVTNPSVSYEVIPSDAGTSPYVLRFDQLEVFHE